MVFNFTSLLAAVVFHHLSQKGFVVSKEIADIGSILSIFQRDVVNSLWWWQSA
jgi:hypothetical protein